MVYSTEQKRTTPKMIVRTDTELFYLRWPSLALVDRPKGCRNGSPLPKLGHAGCPTKGVNVNYELGLGQAFHGDRVTSHAIKITERKVVLVTHGFEDARFRVTRGSLRVVLMAVVANDPDVAPEAVAHHSVALFRSSTAVVRRHPG